MGLSDGHVAYKVVAVVSLIVAAGTIGFVAFSDATAEDFRQAEKNVTDPWETPEPPDCGIVTATENTSFEYCDFTGTYPNDSNES